MRVLVCGGREFNDAALMWATLNEQHATDVFTLVIHGGARGADYMAGLWASETGIEVKVFPADWNRHRKAAGPLRNQQMLAEGKPDLVIAFPGGAGTADMVRRANAAGVEVIKIRGWLTEG